MIRNRTQNAVSRPTNRTWALLALVALAAISGGSGVAVAAAAEGKKTSHATDSREQAKGPKNVASGRQKVAIAITDKGFYPDVVDVNKGEPVEFVFTRKTDKACMKVVVDTGLSKVRMALPLDEAVTIKAQFPTTGVVTYGCDPTAFTGTVNVH